MNLSTLFLFYLSTYPAGRPRPELCWRLRRSVPRERVLLGQRARNCECQLVWKLNARAARDLLRTEGLHRTAARARVEGCVRHQR